ncbi:MAG: penicillin-binding protein [Chitinophagaceae bacterium]|nr:penicillin-binding protein [Chitinophagaceae bacterium]MBK7680363.1 penicillin-binding protein [Chitinophagaceae bacterium]MBK8301794.1 penicillin-binding protein [Chitinophagaceae bacterium]MBK9661140.1 penicillin-binding protein [Chitinophagaceae bacterium]MBK9938741.1 penicillin-binding protein [Chitinophagaceae bacterium]
MKKTVRIFWRIFLVGFGAFVGMVLLANFGVFGKMPSLAELENPSILQASEVYAEDGTLMGKYYTERGNRSNVKYMDISKHVIDALIATEDERFYSHSGVDFKSTMRAMLTAGTSGGGSTITQQLAKALLDQGSKNRAWRVVEKLKEWIIAVKLEKNFTKEEIITLYLNAVPFGNNIYGIRNAARSFFQKEPDRLNVEEAALLVGMLKGNSIYNPVRNPKAALERRNIVLSQMEVNKKITPAVAAKLKATPIKLNYKKLDENTGYAPYFREILKSEIKEALKDVEKPNGGTYNIYDDGLKIYTTINTQMQEYAEEGMAVQMTALQKSINARGDFKTGSIWKGHEKIIEKAIKESDRWKNLEEDGLSDKEIRASFNVKVPMKVFAWNTKREKDTMMSPVDSIKYSLQMEQASFMAMDPVTGEVRAWVGGINFKTYKNDHVNLKTKRQVGSTIKPFLYTQAMEERGFTPETECENVAQNFGGNAWVPSGKKCGGGTMSMANALAFSKNCATAYIMKQVGPKQFADFLSRINIPTKVQPYPSICLGTCDLSMYEMLWGYTIFAGRGFSTKPYSISRIEDRNGNVIKRFDFSVNRKEAVSEVTAYTMAKMMQGTVDKGTARGLRSRVGAAEMGGKTGTTDDNADAWFLGYTPQLLAGSWVGFEYTFMRNQADGNTIARPITEYFFKKVLANKKLGIEKDARFVKPAEMENEINSADIIISDSDPSPGAEGDDQGVGKPEDYDNYDQYENIGPESKPVEEEKIPPVKKDTIIKAPIKKEEPDIAPIGSLVEDPKKSRKERKREAKNKSN